MARTRVDPKLAQDIEDDINEIDDSKPQAKASKPNVEASSCPDCADSLIGPGLLDASTICPKCEGTGKIAVLK